MRNGKYFSTVLALVLIVSIAIGCAAPTPTPTSAPAPSSTAPAATSTPAPTPKATATPTATPAPAPKQAVRLAYGAGSSTGTAYPYNVAVGKSIAKYAPNLQVTLVETGGGEDNWNRILTKDIDLGMFSSTQAFQTYMGVSGIKLDKNVRGLFPLKTTIRQYVVRNDANINSFADLNGKKFNPGRAGTSSATWVKTLFDTLGYKPDYLFAEGAEANEAFQSRKIDAIMVNDSVPGAGVLALQAGQSIKLIGFTQDELKKMRAAFPEEPSWVIPAGSYTNQKTDILTSATIGAVGTTKDAMSEQVAYDLVKAYCLGFNDFLKPLHAQMAAIKSPEDFIIDSYVSPLHAGVIKYLREKGKTIPDALIPPEAK